MNTSSAAGQTAKSLKTCKKLIDEAIEGHGDLAEVLGKHASEVGSITRLALLLQDRKELHDPTRIDPTLTVIDRCCHTLCERIQGIGHDGNTVGGVGLTREDGVLASMIEQLGKAKRNLSIYIQTAQVGLTHDRHQVYYVNVKLVAQVNDAVKPVLQKSLVIDDFIAPKLKEEYPRGGILQLSLEEYETLKRRIDDLATDGLPVPPPKHKVRIVRNNKASGNSIQLNGRVGTSQEEEEPYKIISGNISRDYATQANDAISDNALQMILQMQRGGNMGYRCS